MAGKPKREALEPSAVENYAVDSAPEKKASNVSEKSIANLHPRTDGKSPARYMQVNVYGYEDYLYRMARYRKMTTTKYVLELIKKDAEQHKADYESLKTLSDFNKPHRESPNKKKKATD